MDETTKAAMECGRPLTIFHINEVHQLNPNATHVTNNYYGDQFVPKDQLRQDKPAPPKTQPATRNSQLIIDYVMRLHPAHVRREWQDKYKQLWEEVLQMPEVASVVFDKGRQQNTTFNRNLVANILHLMAEERVMTIEAHATKMAEVLEGDPQASVRAQLGVLPTDRRLTSSITALIKQKGKES